MADKPRSHRPPGKRPTKPPPREPKYSMSEPKPSIDSVFEVDRIRRLVELMKEHDLSEVDLRESRQRIRICRGPREAPRHGPPPPQPAATLAQSATAAIPAKPAADAANIALIKSPMVGTF